MNDIKPISVSKLLLDLENPRFPREVTGQREAINLMLEIQEDKIIRLAKDISAKGVDPSENLMTFESTDEPGFYIVAEGNRRTTALKLIAQPSLADNERIRKLFTKIKETTTRDLSKISCVIFDDEEYEHWVNLKHTGDNKGVGRERWTTPEADRYKTKHGKTSYQAQLYEFIQRQENAYVDILKMKKFIYATNLSRLFGDKKSMGRFGLTSRDGYLYCALPFAKFVGNLKIVLEVMTDIEPGKKKPDFSVNAIYTAADRENFLNDLQIPLQPVLLPAAWRLDDVDAEKISLVTTPDEIFPANPEAVAQPFNPHVKQDENHFDVGDDTFDTKPSPVVDDNSQDTDKKPPAKPIPKTNRNVLIPANLKLNFGGNGKCSKIFNELKLKMTHENTPFSISVMLRVFIDLSLTDFIDKKEIKYKENSLEEQTRNPGLHDKVVMCCNYLLGQKKLKQAQISSICAFSKDKLNAKGTIQQYVHNQHHNPSRDIVNTEWDNFQPLFEAIWSHEMQSS
ncbi:hypothetical protein ACO0K7_17185 [Undibacterium sp. Ji67W]|uniref:hypothetical protein n=1 Tax=Undibacterium sp. Ji67W TaxID=3413042 RepID=UPI003BF06225